MKIILTESESKIIGIIRKYAEGLDSQITLRVAGGWVRDKLLGLESQDMDIAIDRVSGQVFCESLKTFLNCEGVPFKGYHLIC